MLSLLRRRKDPKAALRALLGGYELPSIPASVIEVLSMLRDPDVPMAEVAARVEVDPAVTVKILRLVNSAGFGLAKEVSNILHAVSLLGRSRLESLVLTVAAADRLPRSMRGIEAPVFWRVAARRACVARAFAGELHAATQAEAFTAALLLDIGIPVLAEVKGDAYVGIVDAWRADGGDLVEMERHAFGLDHAEIGGLMASEWGLPDFLADAIGSHHAAFEDEGPEPGVRLAASFRYGEVDDDVATVLATATAAYGFEAQPTRELIDACLAEAQELARFFGA